MTDLTINAKHVRPLDGCVTSMKVADIATAVGKGVRTTSTGVTPWDSASSAGVKGNIGIIVSGEGHAADGAIAAGETVTVVWFGRLVLGATLDTTKQYWATLAGAIGDAAQGFGRSIGSPESADIFMFDPDSAQPTS